MARFFHYTLRQPANILSVVKGRFVSEIGPEQFIWNCRTCFQVMWLHRSQPPPKELNRYAESPERDQVKLRKYLTQPFMSCVYSCCLGPKDPETDLDTFFAARDEDILQFGHRQEDGIFRCTRRFKLPDLCITPDFVHYMRESLFVSCTHGGVCSFTKDGTLSYAGKPVNVVLTVFPFGGEGYVRIEEGNVIARYEVAKKERDVVHELATELVFFDVFPFDNERIAFVTKDSILLYRIGRDVQPSKESFGNVLTFVQCQLTSSPHSFLCCRNSALNRSGEAEFFRISEQDGRLMLTEVKLDPKRVVDILRMFNLGDNIVLITNKAADHEIRYFDDKGLVKCEKYMAMVGGKTLISFPSKPYSRHVPSGADQDRCMNVAPQIGCISGPCLGLTLQGIPAKRLGDPLPLNECPNCIFPMQIDKNRYLLVSFEKSSRLLKINQDSISLTNDFHINDTGSTVAIHEWGHDPSGGAAGLDSFSMTIQVTARGCTLLSGSLQNKRDIDLQIGQVIHSCSDRRRILFVVKPDRPQEEWLIHIFGLVQESHGPVLRPMTQNPYRAKGEVTAIELSPRDRDGLASHVAMGWSSLHENQGSYFVMQKVCYDSAERDEETFYDKMEAPISSIKFLDHDKDPWSGKVLIGLYRGSVLLGDVDFQKKHVLNLQLFQLGESPIKIVPLTKTRLIAAGARPAMLVYENGTFECLPLAVTSCAFAACVSSRRGSGYPEEQEGIQFVTVSGRDVSLYLTDGQKNTTNIRRLPFRGGDIVGVVPIVAQGMEDSVIRPLFPPQYLVATTTELYCCNVQSGETRQIPMDVKKGRFCLFQGATGSHSDGLVVSVTEKEARDRKKSIITLFCTICPYDSNIQTSVFRTLEQVAECSVDGRVTSIAAFALPPPRSHVYFVAFTTQSEIKLMCNVSGKGNPSLEFVGTYPISGWTIKNLCVSVPTQYGLKTRIDFALGDAQRSVKLLTYTMSKNKFKLLAEEGTFRPVTSLQLLAKRNALVFLGGDKLGNVFILTYGKEYTIQTIPIPLDPRVSKAKARLHLVLNYYVGDLVSGVGQTSDPFNFFWYTTISGGLGGFMILDISRLKTSDAVKEEWRKRKKILRMVELELARLFFEWTQCDQIAFRNKHFPANSVIDLDMVAIFEILGSVHQQAIIRTLQERISKMKEFEGEEPFTVESLTMLIRQVTKYFTLNCF